MRSEIEAFDAEVRLGLGDVHAGRACELVDDLGEDLLLRDEVRVEGAVGDPGPPGDVADVGVEVAVLLEQARAALTSAARVAGATGGQRRALATRRCSPVGSVARAQVARWRHGTWSVIPRPARRRPDGRVDSLRGRRDDVGTTDRARPSGDGRTHTLGDDRGDGDTTSSSRAGRRRSCRSTCRASFGPTTACCATPGSPARCCDMFAERGRPHTRTASASSIVGGERVTYQEVWDRSARVAGGLRGRRVSSAATGWPTGTATRSSGASASGAR